MRPVEALSRSPVTTKFEPCGTRMAPSLVSKWPAGTVSRVPDPLLVSRPRLVSDPEVVTELVSKRSV